MPGWYIHTEAAKILVDRLRAGDVPAGFPLTDDQRQDLADVCYTWRNYLALGAIGPDLFYLLPDYFDAPGFGLRRIIQWTLDIWEVLDSQIIGKWEKWVGPVETNNEQLASQLTGGLSNQLASVLTSLAATQRTAVEDLLTRLGDWFGVLTSGVPQGFADTAFYWSDMFHYRRTYQFPHVLFRSAFTARAAARDAGDDTARQDAEAVMAFALGWMSHCGTDVTGHPFTNAKCGGPFRNHWQRHHLVENHFDGRNYAARNPGPLYGELGTSALHFRVAFRLQAAAPYNGRTDAPAYDYFASFPGYDDANTPSAAAARRALFDLDSGELPGHLVDALLAAMQQVYADDLPKVLTQDPDFSANDEPDEPDGRPNANALNEMWQIFYHYLKMVSSDGLSVRRPDPPPVLTDHSFPRPPGSSYGVDGDASRGADIDDDEFNLLDLILAIFTWVIYIGQVVLWLVTVLPGLITDVASFPARLVHYYTAELPAWYLYLLSRRLLVATAFLMPKPEEVDPGLVTLGTSTGFFSLAVGLDDPLGGAPPLTPTPTEPSGRADHSSASGMDTAYPRNIVRDRPPNLPVADLAALLGLTRVVQYAGDAGAGWRPSEWLAPWRYPRSNQAGAGVPAEPGGTHVGPYVVGDDATVLLPGMPGDAGARNRLEDCQDPRDTRTALDELLPQDHHLGGPVDYSLYLVGRMARAADENRDQLPVPDFNLDADRGYAWRCWDWDRHADGPDQQWVCLPDKNKTDQSDFHYRQPCTPPQLFNADNNHHAAVRQGNTVDGSPLDSQWYDPTVALRAHYLLHRQAEPDPVTDPCAAAPPLAPEPGGQP